ncbi:MULTISPECIES: PP2C family protein-serine/threonine phosphatase [Miniimonas]|uniref:PP2C family protein-serine/threonine phosphatase n=1 Tax=Miniimonas TaxID=947525 RepID=UPI00131F37FB|nr:MULTISPECIES: protein phosphatase 2C domain-containing protein [Miniimonas]
MSVSFRAAAATDLGTVRTNNEDSALVSARLVALADGMGGHAAGEVASAVVMRALTELARSGRLAAVTLTDAVQHARDTLRAMSHADPEMSGMGTTLVALADTPAGIKLVHIGDSRIYRLRDGVLTQLTTDHTHVQRLVETGRLSPDQVRNHPFRSVILRSIDDTGDDLPDVGRTAEVAVGDRILLCSDGLSDYVTEEAFAPVLASGDAHEAAEGLVALALEVGTRDNVTAIVLDVVPRDEGELAAADGASPHMPDGVLTLGADLTPEHLTDQARAVLEASFAAWQPGQVPAPPTATEPAGRPVDAAHASDGGAQPGDDVAVASASAAAPSADVAGGAAEAGDTPSEDPAADGKPDVAARERDGDEGDDARAPGPMTIRERLWLGLVLVAFAATAVGVWVTQS